MDWCLLWSVATASQGTREMCWPLVSPRPVFPFVLGGMESIRDEGQKTGDCSEGLSDAVACYRGSTLWERIW